MTVTRSDVDVDLEKRAAAIEHALQVGGSRLDPEAVSSAEAVIERTGERLRLGPQFTIVALVGATGSGKSSLFNALAGMDLAETGVRRPTTGRAMACVWGEAKADELLDWLDVPQRYRTRRETVLDGAREAELHGLVLLDMPDHDSTQLAHRLEVDRLVELVDLLVWVVDPQKYADEALHHGYLTRLHNHDGVMIVVLNQVDKLAPVEAETCLNDLRRLLDSDGLESVRLLVASATTGRGVDDLRRMLADVVEVQSAVAARAAADLDRVADRLLESVATQEPEAKDLKGVDDLVGTLAQAAGVPVVLDAVESGYQRRAEHATGWPLRQWWLRLRPDPLRRLGLPEGAEGDLRSVTDQQPPEVTPAESARIELAVREVVTGVARALPRPWADSVRMAGDRPGAELTTALDAALREIDLTPPRQAWWSVVRAVQLVLAGLAVGGFAWLAVAGVLGLVGAHPSTPAVLRVPVPLVLFVVGLVGGAVTTFLARRAVAEGAGFA